MIDTEVERLRRLRSSALRVRAVARSLGRSKGAASDPQFERGACIAWRVARSVSGRLRAHPNASFQKDAGLGVLIWNSVVATATAVTASSHAGALREFHGQLRALYRELDDARALTWASELSDMCSRSQYEIRSLVGVADARAGSTLQARSAPLGTVAGDWPFLAL